ncbi:MAG: hypothetical protein ABI091_30980 [Ferruginibacter sp.]
MRYGVFLLIFITANCFCSCQNREAHPPQIVFSYRSELSKNNYYTYFDSFVITEYKNSVWHARELFDYSMKYIDSVKAKYPVSGVAFIGESADGYLPDINFSTMVMSRKYFVVSFYFSNGLEKYKDKPIFLHSLVIWKNAVPISFERTQLDSVLNSKAPLDNGNN